MSLPMTRERPRRSGAAMVETAVMAMVLMMVAFAFLEFSRVLMVEAVLNNAARAGARSGALAIGTYQDIQAAVSQAVRTSHVIPLPPPSGNGEPPLPASLSGSFEVRVNDTLVNGSEEFDNLVQRGAAIEVRLTVPYAEVSWIPGTFWLAPDLALAGGAVAYREP